MPGVTERYIFDYPDAVVDFPQDAFQKGKALVARDHFPHGVQNIPPLR
jgi:hypothetical protein